MTDHDLLVRIDERVQKIDRCLSEHLRDHKALGSANRKCLVMLVVAAITTVGSLITTLVK